MLRRLAVDAREALGARLQQRGLIRRISGRGFLGRRHRDVRAGIVGLRRRRHQRGGFLAAKKARGELERGQSLMRLNLVRLPQ